MADLINYLKRQGYRMAQDITLRTWKKDDLIKRIRVLENNWAAALERCENQYNLLDKYRWHDLRTDPKDLPDTKRFVEVRTEDSLPYYFGWYDTESEAGMWYDVAGFSMDPIKWREIEERMTEKV